MDPLTGGWMTDPAADEVIRTPVEEASVAARLRRLVAQLAERLGFPPERVARLQLAVSEAASNLSKHAQQGELLLRVVRDADHAAIEMVCTDSGPGIADVPAVMVDGQSSTGTLGIGMGMIARIADHSHVYSLPRRGTVLIARFEAVPGTFAETPHAGLNRPITGEEQCGDAFAASQVDEVVYAMLCDGLGHGPLAALAAREAVRAVQDSPLPMRPADLLQRVHQRLGRTRGGAVAVAAINGRTRRVDFAGLGNVAGWIVDGERRQGMISVPGIAGHQARGLREHRYELPPGAVVVLHSDGLTSRWGPHDFPGLSAQAPLVIAATLLRDAGVRRDDRAVLVVRPPDRTSGVDTA
ncbi:Anti-sigma regulatory factor (Ser/Thr protein kinase) [Thermomonospora echinospora]|uniref:Anti-sigma regulatory factor (Ser/Thr protein kinase) n=1 Tax=Thermomonospora echinospora TaxID=1992 RepID=A0A1H6BX36_9ACTN|nr:ATP-binding SpoIIE family protein phosphatase [Thermomonospora echinospora]SEG65017.1 Anti-sigma regulatory factor (Ser/Thr protein kinase) [Thermomonospora echinospora]